MIDSDAELDGKIAFIAGNIAYDAGYNFYDNPYTDCAILFECWSRGWESAANHQQAAHA